MSQQTNIAARTAFADAGGRPIPEALHAYEEEMRGYGFDAVRESAARGHLLVRQDPLPASQI
ncbi:hypothetical protein [Kitasatospora aureofaciens]|uniref:hypothetical protein n=1 Tax=Kitasatospora aureofaciens TaxID=1894 RepID=UPI000525DB2F|nr:hypothetical protein [Kitasatospora aureofaciens]HJD84395.1 hypothetical protein [Kitasatospora aureofaciens]